MAIISVSLDNQTLSELSDLLKTGFSSRSDAIRAGIKALVAEKKARSRLSGTAKAVLLVIHTQDAEAEANDPKHSFDDVIRTQLHSDMRDGRCLEVFIMEGRAERVAKFVERMQASSGIESIKLVVL
ncbi:MAG: CopG family ribbon-helix-helix protein [Candidatus Micrarchaeota archaeon]|nr:CopG family ribbon-helix-helix protein [Candidatus Micrarchaeota archaeon]